MTEIESQRQPIQHHRSATRSQYLRDLSNAVPADLRRMMAAAKAGLVQRHSDASADAIDRLAAVRRWVDEADAARKDPEKTTILSNNWSIAATSCS